MIQLIYEKKRKISGWQIPTTDTKNNNNSNFCDELKVSFDKKKEEVILCTCE